MAKQQVLVPPVADDPRHRIVVHSREHEVNDDAVRALADVPGVYQRSGSLVRVVAQEDDSPDDAVIRRFRGSPIVSDLSRASLREEMTRAAAFFRTKGKKVVETPPPDYCVSAVLDRQRWAGVPYLRAVVSHPVVLSDGRVLSKGGFDPKTGLYMHIGDCPGLTVPDRPTRDESRAAVATLLDVVGDFRFAAPHHRSAWLASVLSPAAWFMFEGPAPFFLVNGNCAGVGKGLLADVSGLILTGRRFSIMSYDPDTAELRKRITALVVQGERLVLMDNLTGDVGNGTLDAALTGTRWMDRFLGASRIFDGPLDVCWFGTGNNVQLCGDTARRTCEVRIETAMENPEERSGFRHPDLRSYVFADRGRLLSAVLTVLKGWVAAGKPEEPGLKPWGSFEGWSGSVRQAVVWAGQPDPGPARMSVQVLSDPGRESFGLLLRKLAKDDQQKPADRKRGYTAGEILKLAETDAEIRSAVEEFCGRLDSRSLGNKLRNKIRTPAAGHFLDRGPDDNNIARWVVRPVAELLDEKQAAGNP